MYKNKSSNGRNNIAGINIQRIESGQRFVTDIELKAFATVLGVTSDELLSM